VSEKPTVQETTNNVNNFEPMHIWSEWQKNEKKRKWWITRLDRMWSTFWS